ncbi:MAG: 1-deoxy-D-xylulose-5-phosphate synthase [Spirochaetota bacterium]|nr:1-deoxy-D-xylulose-5-phosphate synthase [Spirochaetota bacterium]
MLLDSIKNISDFRKLDVQELNTLSNEIREYIIDVVSTNGGHLSSSLGVVELTIALHYVLNTPKDKIIWDVGHQCYAHKIITNRKNEFEQLRRFGGISGFPKISESLFDVYNTGHSSTSLSLALGEAVGRDLSREKYKVVAVIGDGSLTGGMAFEALNQIGHMKRDIIIILNDNEHFISNNVGALSRSLMRMITGSLYNRLRKRSYEVIKRIPRSGHSIYDFFYRMEESLKGMVIPGIFFEELGIRYFGPIDGHNIKLLINIISRIKQINSGPRILHVITKKGKGYDPAERNPAKFHGVGPFDRKAGVSKSSKKLSYSEIVGKTLAEISKSDKKVIAITAAMKLGTGLYEFEKRAPNRFFDVGIAEQHAITFAGALASKGLKPFVSIYSTFLQRAVDQLIHDIAIMNLPIRLLIDRAGIVGRDGETHHGLFDISIIKSIPNFVFLAPSNGTELRDMLYFAYEYNDGPIAIRYPKGNANSDELKVNEFNEFILGKSKRLTNGKDIAIFALGDMVDIALQLNKLLKREEIGSSVVNLLSIKPLDIKGIERVIRNTRYFVTMENGSIVGGISEYIIANIDGCLRDKFLFPIGFPDEFITHGDNADLFKKYGIDSGSLLQRLLTLVNQKNDYEKGSKA